ncbi:kinetochore protein mis18 isoform X1 [Octopus sinensis]|uniref:Kinetochore protein mis18 isoform X1 n=2 Tax=Octopus sinensis TaxID=2607531 RepID=A0A6P7TNE4_9MOLL|nr:kinetochore protein mis18 isoform X1 [Octopus sinensis]
MKTKQMTKRRRKKKSSRQASLLHCGPAVADTMSNQTSFIKMFDVFPDHVNHLFPIVFQCSNCKAIFGDSLSWEITNEAMQVICLSKASDFVIVDEEILIQRSESNQISTYSKLSCKGCRRIIGKFFHSTYYDFDQFRGLFTFHVNQISIYQTGQEGTYKDITQLEYIDPIKCVLVSLNERLTLIEKKLGIVRGSNNIGDIDDHDGRNGNVSEEGNNEDHLSNSEDITLSRGTTITSNSSSQVQTDSIELHGNLSSSEGDTSGSFSELSNG